MANVVEAGDCWLGTERSGRTRGAYQQVNFRVPGLGGRVVHFSAHILAWVCAENGTGYQDMDELFLWYWEFRASGLVLDHTCNNPECRRPTHLDPCTQKERLCGITCGKLHDEA